MDGYSRLNPQWPEEQVGKLTALAPYVKKNEIAKYAKPMDPGQLDATRKAVSKVRIWAMVGGAVGAVLGVFVIVALHWWFGTPSGTSHHYGAIPVATGSALGWIGRKLGIARVRVELPTFRR